MPIYTCSNPTPMSLAGVLAKLDSDPDFASFFSTTLQDAYRGDQTAIDCVDAYLQPTVRELLNLSIPRSQVGPMRKCTESGNLVLAKCKEKAPSLFSNEGE